MDRPTIPGRNPIVENLTYNDFVGQLRDLLEALAPN